MSLTGINLLSGILLIVIVQHLTLAHAYVGDVALSG